MELTLQTWFSKKLPKWQNGTLLVNYDTLQLCDVLTGD